MTVKIVTDDLVDFRTGYTTYLGAFVKEINGTQLFLRPIKVERWVLYYDYYTDEVIDKTKIESVLKYKLLNYHDVDEDILKWFDVEENSYLIDREELESLTPR